jgi:hypothetical protein
MASSLVFLPVFKIITCIAPYKWITKVSTIQTISNHLGVCLGPLFELVVEIEAGLSSILLNPFFKVVNLAFFKNLTFAVATCVGAVIPSDAINIIEELGEASRVVGGEVFDYV